MKINFAYRSDVGIARHGLENEDSGTTTLYKDSANSIKFIRDIGDLAVVCDGMGGEEAGEFASRIAMQTVIHQFNLLTSPPDARLIENLLIDWILKAHQAILSDAKQNKSREGMGSTITIVWFVEDAAHIAWVGDSRVYLARQNDLTKPITQDHSWVWENVIGKKYSRSKNEEARLHAESNIILQSLGGFEKPKPSYQFISLQSDDRILVCSDGLNSMLSDDQIAQYLEQKDVNPAELTEQLIQAANNAGGNDNITVLIADISEANVSIIHQEGTNNPLMTKKKSLNLSWILAILFIIIAAAGIYFYSKHEKESDMASNEKKKQEKVKADSLQKIVDDMKAKEAGEKKDSTDNTNKVAVVGDRIQEQKINKPEKKKEESFPTQNKTAINKVVEDWNALVIEKGSFVAANKELKPAVKTIKEEFERLYEDALTKGWVVKGAKNGYKKPESDSEYKKYETDLETVKKNYLAAKKALEDAKEKQKTNLTKN
jgi:protein phosphatase